MVSPAPLFHSSIGELVTSQRASGLQKKSGGEGRRRTGVTRIGRVSFTTRAL